MDFKKYCNTKTIFDAVIIVLTALLGVNYIIWVRCPEALKEPINGSGVFPEYIHRLFNLFALFLILFVLTGFISFSMVVFAYIKHDKPLILRLALCCGICVIGIMLSYFSMFNVVGGSLP